MTFTVEQKRLDMYVNSPMATALPAQSLVQGARYMTSVGMPFGTRFFQHNAYLYARIPRMPMGELLLSLSDDPHCNKLALAS